MTPRECPFCKASLDWGEKCTCQDEKAQARAERELRDYMIRRAEAERQEAERIQKEIDSLPDFAKKFALLGQKV